MSRYTLGILPTNKPKSIVKCLIPQESKLISRKGLTRAIDPRYIDKAVKEGSEAETTKVAPRADSEALNLDNYIV
jgi:hypothetical protein